MFTGLVEHVGEVVLVRQADAGREIRIRAPFADLVEGESVAVNGACLTVRGVGKDWFDVAAIVTTLDRTTIGRWREGTRVNLERALPANARLGGHLVQGHVDFVGNVVGRAQRDDAVLIEIDLPASFEPLFVLHGAVAIDGVSLTVNRLAERGLQVALIDYTLRNTTLGKLRVGDPVQVEADVVAKHVRRLLQAYLRDNAALESLADLSLEH